jgi:hypothetical protein
MLGIISENQKKIAQYWLRFPKQIIEDMIGFNQILEKKYDLHFLLLKILLYCNFPVKHLIRWLEKIPDKNI